MEAASFPLRVAAVDVGSNAIRFLAAEFSDPHHSATLEYERVPVRMGHAAFVTGELDEKVMDAAVEAMERFRGRMDELGIENYRAVATSAVRESRNGSKFVERVWDEAGLRLEPITGTEEARVVWLAIRDRMPLGDRSWVLVDLGGGSVEVSLAEGGTIQWTESLALGTVRLLEELEEADGSPARFRRLLEEYTAVLKVPAAARQGFVAGMIATGGNIEELAELVGAKPDSQGVSRLRVDTLHETVGRLADLSVQERIEKLGLREDRADVILPAAIVYERIAALATAETIIVPHVGVKEGLLLDLVDDLTAHVPHQQRQEEEVVAGAIALGRRYDFDEAHAHHVCRLALSLFDDLHELHKLETGDRRLLRAASLLHDIGQFIAYPKHHKHSLYLITNSELVGFTQAETGLVALVARYHRRAEPKDAHEGWSDLGDGDRKRVARLASMLRLADALDREHRQQVEQLRATLDGKTVLLDLLSSGELLLEQWAVRKKGHFFEETFGVDLRLRVRQTD